MNNKYHDQNDSDEPEDDDGRQQWEYEEATRLEHAAAMSVMDMFNAVENLFIIAEGSQHGFQAVRLDANDLMLVRARLSTLLSLLCAGSQLRAVS